MNDFYLDPQAIKEQCKEAINDIDNINKRLMNSVEAVNNFINDPNITSEAFDSYKEALADYQCYMGVKIKVNERYQEDYINLSNNVGNEVLNSKTIYNTINSMKEVINNEEVLMERVQKMPYDIVANSSDKTSILTNFSSNNKLSENAQYIIQLNEAKIQKYDAIESATRNLFEVQKTVEDYANSILDNIDDAFEVNGGTYVPDKGAKWRSDFDKKMEEAGKNSEQFLKMYFKYRGVDETQLEDLDTQGFSVDTLYATYVKCGGERDRRFVIDLMKGSKKSFKDAVSIDPDKLSDESILFFSGYMDSLLLMSAASEKKDKRKSFQVKAENLLNSILHEVHGKTKRDQKYLDEQVKIDSDNKYLLGKFKGSEKYTEKYLAILEQCAYEKNKVYGELASENYCKDDNEKDALFSTYYETERHQKAALLFYIRLHVTYEKYTNGMDYMTISNLQFPTLDAGTNFDCKVEFGKKHKEYAKYNIKIGIRGEYVSDYKDLEAMKKEQEIGEEEEEEEGYKSTKKLLAETTKEKIIDSCAEVVTKGNPYAALAFKCLKYNTNVANETFSDLNNEHVKFTSISSNGNVSYLNKINANKSIDMYKHRGLPAFIAQNYTPSFAKTYKKFFMENNKFLKSFNEDKNRKSKIRDDKVTYIDEFQQYAIAGIGEDDEKYNIYKGYSSVDKKTGKIISKPPIEKVYFKANEITAGAIKTRSDISKYGILVGLYGTEADKKNNWGKDGKDNTPKSKNALSTYQLITRDHNAKFKNVDEAYEKIDQILEQHSSGKSKKALVMAKSLIRPDNNVLDSITNKEDKETLYEAFKLINEACNGNRKGIKARYDDKVEKYDGDFEDQYEKINETR